MDGKLCALDVLNGGRTVWEVDLEAEPLMGGTLGKVQPMEADGGIFNLVPALDGSLYMYSREERLLEPIPLNTEILLQVLHLQDFYYKVLRIFYGSIIKASIRIGHDAVAGGKTVSTSGVDPLTGEIRYHCTSSQCNKFRSDEHILSTLIFRRSTNRIQAVDSLTGSERWNLSVSEYDVSLVVGNIAEFPFNTRSGVKFLVQPPDGVITVVDSCGNKMWSRQIGSHIARTWQMEGAVLNEISLFENENILTLADDSSSHGTVIHAESLFYLGTVNDEPFIMQSNMVRNELKRIARNFEYGEGSHSPGKQLMVVRNNAFLVQQETLDGILCSAYKKSFTAQAVNNKKNIHGRHKHSISPNSCSNSDSVFLIGESDIRSATFEISEGGSSLSDQGWFIMRPSHLNERPRVIVEDNLKCSANIRDGVNHSFQFVDAGSLQWLSAELRSVSSGPSLGNISSSVIPVNTPMKKISNHNSQNESFHSKFLEDFQPVKLLGHGGFGVVFKAKNRLDEFLYAVKRISVENNERAIERVLREVRAMAQLDHPGIIRYYHTWIERPPNSWQEEDNMKTGSNKYTRENFKGKCMKSELSSLKENVEVLEDQIHSDRDLSSQINISSGNSSWFNDSVGKYCTTTSSSGSSQNIDLEHSDSIIFYRNSGDNFQQIPNSSKQCKDISLRKQMVVTSVDEDLLPCNNTNFVYIYIQMQLCKEQTLHAWLSQHKKWSDRPIRKMKSWMLQLCSATNYIHQQGLIHRDIKPQNIFFASDQSLKIGDLGLVTKCVRVVDQAEGGDYNISNVRTYTDNVGTRSYMSPEQLANLPYTFKVDIFSLGLIFCELVIPFQTCMERSKTLSDLQQGNMPETLRDMSEENNFVNWLTKINPDERPTCKDILESNYLSEEETLVKHR
uniref:Protein kinase domain-containing protein n=1 Tax=Heterorhabditis bacteriophora TaxID=37862 RepID=A0A1I7WXN7_HETBA